jgi:dTMP kinase
VPGLFVTLEGPEGSGKSTQLRLLADALAVHDPLVVREPGGTALGESIRDLLLHREQLEISPEAEAHLFMAARAELVAERIQPALAAGRIVLCDRYHDATLVYQGEVGGVSVPWPASFPRPDLTALLLVPAELGLERQRAARGTPDRIGGRPLDFHRQVVEGYRRRASLEPERFLVLDATRPAEEVRDALLARIHALLVGAAS